MAFNLVICGQMSPQGMRRNLPIIISIGPYYLSSELKQHLTFRILHISSP